MEKEEITEWWKGKSPADFEYVVPNLEEGSLNLNCHHKRYEFALPHCKKKNVLDIACGVGYGSDILSKVVNTSIGVDKNENAIWYANAHYKSKKNKFVESDAIEYLKKNQNYDIIVCFETLEHINDKEFVSLIKKGIPIVGSVPYDEKVLTKYHKRRYKEEDIKRLFERRNVEFWYQHREGLIDKNNQNIQNLIWVVSSGL